MNRFFSLALGLSVSVMMVATTHIPNPVLPYDYSDPDVVKVGDNYYMTSSSFNSIPGLQILQSGDLINWTIVDAALRDTVPGTGHSKTPEWGGGVWAPSIRHHDGRFYIYYGDPDRGIYCVRSEKSNTLPCRWESPVLVKTGRGLIDPCPLWDENGKTYLVHAFAGSRAGIKSLLAVCELSEDGLTIRTEDRIVFDGHAENPTIEGPKFYQRNGYYYILAPAGGVSTGWQLALRSRNVYVPYEWRVILAQGKTTVNGPHQGAWVDNWFLHFQDVGVAGRIVHLEPLRWEEDWPVIATGQPVRYVDVDLKDPICEKDPLFEDHFVNTELALSWQWSGNRQATYYFCNATDSLLRLFTYPAPSIEDAPNQLLQKIPANRKFVVTAKVRFIPNKKTAEYESAGLMISGKACHILEAPKNGEWVWLRVEVSKTQMCQFYTSNNGVEFTRVGNPFQAEAGHWIGAKVGLFATRKPVSINDSGYMDVDWFVMQ